MSTPTEAQPSTTPTELKLLCSLVMSDDHGSDSVLNKDGDDCEDAIVQNWLDRESKAHGYDSWIVAYHEIDRPLSTPTEAVCGTCGTEKMDADVDGYPAGTCNSCFANPTEMRRAVRMDERASDSMAGD